MSASSPISISANDRLSFTVFVAVALHAMLVLTDFLPEEPNPAPFTMEITLSRYDDAEKPDQADFLAQTNQLGSGTEEEKSELTTTTVSQEQNTLLQESASPSQSMPEQSQAERQLITSTRSTRLAPSLFDLPNEESSDRPLEPQKSILERSLEIAQLEASLDDQLRNYAKRPRVTRLTGASTMKAIDARYVETVVESIEKVGKRYFPSEGGRKLYGKPRVAISIYADGSIKSVEILESSGNLVLDSKTKDIVHRAAPFAPFPKEVRRERDVLELIRTFSYNNKGVASF